MGLGKQLDICFLKNQEDIDNFIKLSQIYKICTFEVCSTKKISFLEIHILLEKLIFF